MGVSLSEPTFGRKISKMDKDIKKLYRKVANTKKVETIQAGGLNLTPASPSDDVSTFIKRAGDSFTGPIGFEPKLVVIEDGAIDIGEETNFHGSRVIVSTEASASSDFLVAIKNPKYNGQLLFLQGVATQTVTLVDATNTGTAWATATPYITGVQVGSGGVVYVCNTAHTSAAADEPGVGANWEDFWTLGNLETIDGVSFDIVDDDIIIIQFDSTDNRWQQITKGKQVDSDPTQIIDGDSKVIVNDATPDVQIQLDGITLAAWNVDGGGDERLLFSGAYCDLNGVTLAGVDIVVPDGSAIRPTDHTVLHAFTGTIGLSVSTAVPDVTAAGNVGALKIPYKISTDDSPSSSTLNDWFGDANGCIGLQFDNDAPDVHTLWAKSNSAWHRMASA